VADTLTQPWRPIAWRWNDRKGSWCQCDDAPIAYDAARALIGQNGKAGDPGHLFAHQVVGNRTVLVWKPARRAGS
jgi:hypothetical protein